MKPEELAVTLPLTKGAGPGAQRMTDAETICSRLPSFEELEEYVLSLPHALTLLDVICEVHAYYERRLKGEG